MRPTPSPLSAAASTGVPAAGSSPAQPAGGTTPLGGEEDRLARRMNDVVVRRIFAAGLDLHAALGLLGEDGLAGERPGAAKIHHAIDELDLAIRDIRNILFEHGRGGPP